MKPKKPNVLVAGFPRSGSTYLYRILNQHPQIFIPSLKEINYFNRDHFFFEAPEIFNPRHLKKKSWYYNFFRTNKKVVMDFSILSCLDVASARRVKKELGEVKILFVMRNKKDFLKSVEKMIERWRGDVEMSKEYSDQKYYIQPYLREFSKVHFFHVENFNKTPKKEIKRLCKFLEIEDFNFDLEVDKHRSKESEKNSFFQILKRKSYILLVRFFYSIISLFVMASAMPTEKKEKDGS